MKTPEAAFKALPEPMADNVEVELAVLSYVHERSAKGGVTINPVKHLEHLPDASAAQIDECIRTCWAYFDYPLYWREFGRSYDTYCFGRLTEKGIRRLKALQHQEHRRV